MHLRKTLANALIRLARRLYRGNPEIEAMYLKQQHEKTITPISNYILDYYTHVIKLNTDRKE